MIMLVGIFLVAIILSSIHQGYREGMSHHDEEEQVKGEEHAASLIDTDIEHKMMTMQDSNQYNDYKDEDGSDDGDDDGGDEEGDDNSDMYGPGGEQDIFGPGGEQHHSHHHKHHKHHNHNKHNKHHNHHDKHPHNSHHHSGHHSHHQSGHRKTEYMNTMHDTPNDSMYMLKSESVPPICPACPQTTACPKKKPCAPCPPCARCPDNNFECKKVPNYEGGSSSMFPANMFGPSSSGSEGPDEEDGSAPQPYLNSFSQF